MHTQTLFNKLDSEKNENLNKDIRPLPAASVIFSTTPLEKDISEYGNQNELLEDISKKISHVMIYNNERVYHAVDNRAKRVKSHEVTQVIKILDAPEQCIVLSCKDEEINATALKMAERWDTKEPTTPFSLSNGRSLDSDRLAIEYELYRAFRSYWRNNQDPLLPLSNYGVSCNQFVSSIFKAAIIDRLFPKGLPKNVKEKFHDIEKIKKENNYTKLKQLDSVNYEEFYQLIKTTINESSIDNSKKNSFFEFLLIRIKGHDIKNFLNNIRLFPDMWQFSGYVMYLKKENKYEPYLIGHQLYVAWKEHIQPDKPSRVITEKELEILNTLTHKSAEISVNNTKP